MEYSSSSRPYQFRKVGYGSWGLGAGVMLGTSAVVMDSQSAEKEGETFTPRALLRKIDFPYGNVTTEIPPAKLSRKIVNEGDTSGLNIRLYQYQTCPFCSKVRSFLDYYGFSYEVVEVHPVTRKQLKFSQTKKVPLVIVQGANNLQISDSSFIVSILRSFSLNPKDGLDKVVELYPLLRDQDEKGKEVVFCENKYFLMCHDTASSKDSIAAIREEREWREWVDDVFVHVISPNVYRTWSESLQTFRWFSQVGSWEMNFPAWERALAVYVGAAAMYMIAKRLKKRHCLKENVRESMYEAVNTWLDAIGPSRKFMGGAQPNLADLAMYGSLLSFEGTSTFEEVLANTQLRDWFFAVKEGVNGHAGAQELQAALKKAGK